jgi:zinc/manganese transport system permease protein
MNPSLSWNLLDDLQQLLAFHFMVNALIAGTIAALVAGPIGYLMVLRRQTFVGHTLAVIGFPGAAAATLLSLDVTFGYFAFCLVGALVIAAVPTGGRAGDADGEESAVIGLVQATALGLGFYFVSLYHGFLGGINNLLFGTIIGVSDNDVHVLLIAGIVCLVALALVGRRILFITVDPDVAAAQGLRVRLLGAAFLLLLGTAAAGASQVTGSLLIFALLVAPPAAAVRLTARPVVGMVLAAVIGVAVVWLGAGIAYFSPYPIGFWVSTFGFGAFVLATIYRATSDELRRRVGTALA